MTEERILKRASLSSSSLVHQKHSLDHFHIRASLDEPCHKLSVLERVAPTDVAQSSDMDINKNKNKKPGQKKSQGKKKKEKVRQALHSLSLENERLKSQLALLQSGITSVSHVLQDSIETTPVLSQHVNSQYPSLSDLEAWSLPPLLLCQEADQERSIDTNIDTKIIETTTLKADSLARLLLTMESSLDGFQTMLERLEDKEAHRKNKKRLARAARAQVQGI